MMGISMATAAYGAYAQHQTAKQQTKLIEEQMANEQQEITEKASNEMGERVRAARREAARRRVAAGESGVSGQSLDLDVQNTFGQANQDLGIVARDAMFAGRASDVRARAERTEVRDVNALQAGLQIAGAGVQGYQTGADLQNVYKELKIKRKKS